MTDEQLGPERAAAYELLAQVVAENSQARRRSFGASVKPELRRRTSGGFDEGRLRFASFGAFLRAAEAAGAIEIHKAPRGPDVILAPPGEEPVVEAPTLAGRHRIRADLWDCFVDWDDRYLRVYDAQNDQAVRYPASRTALEPADRTELRRLVAEQPERFHSIEPVPFATQLDWMRAFVDEQKYSPAREELQTAMASARPARAFSQLLNSHSALRSQWSARRVSLVEAQIQRWADQEGLSTIEIVETVEESPSRQSDPDRTATANSSDAEADRLLRMRDQIKRAIDRMPASELERLPIPFGYSFEA